MINLPAKYQERSLNPDKPIWAWATLFKGLFPHSCADIDFQTTYRGHTIFIESKPMDGEIANWQRSHLMQLARASRHWVLLVGVDYNAGGSVKWWSWVDRDAWPFRRYRQLGGTKALCEEIETWKKTIDVMEDANAEASLCYRILRAMCRRPWNRDDTPGPDALAAI